MQSLNQFFLYIKSSHLRFNFWRIQTIKRSSFSWWGFTDLLIGLFLKFVPFILGIDQLWYASFSSKIPITYKLIFTIWSRIIIAESCHVD